MTGLFITGTDTGAGKTYVTAGIARALRQQGTSVRVCKPVATGASESDGQLLSEDTILLGQAAGMRASEVTAFTCREPASPPVAARAEGQSLSLAQLVEAVKACARPGALLLVEGVGGLLCPLTDTETVADLVRQVQLPLVIVARRALGTLNHTLLTLEAAQARGLPVAGLVVTETQPTQGLAEATAVDELRWRVSVPILAVVPHRPEADGLVPELAAVDWAELARKSASSD